MSVQGLLEGKVAVITGAGSGVGRAACSLFASHGAKIVAADIDQAAVEDTVKKLESENAVAVQCDVADEAAVQALLRRAVEAFGRLDVMFNNAGITILNRPGEPPRTFLDATDDDVQRLQSVNVGGVIHGCKASIQQFRAQGGGGVIVNTASVAGLIGFGGAVYGSTKGAVAALTRALAIELAPDGIRINSVCPAAMPTNFAGKGIGELEPVRRHMASLHPLGRVIEPVECANAALFLASDLAANITGVNLPVDGGLSAGVPVRRSG